MDPITILMSVLSLAGKPLADQAIKDGYAGLKALIVRRFGATNPKLESTLADYGEDPETYEKPAMKVLREAGVDRDPEVLEQATKLLEQAGELHQGTTIVTASGERSVAIGGGMSGSTIVTGDQSRSSGSLLKRAALRPSSTASIAACVAAPGQIPAVSAQTQTSLVLGVGVTTQATAVQGATLRNTYLTGGVSFHESGDSSWISSYKGGTFLPSSTATIGLQCLAKTV